MKKFHLIDLGPTNEIMCIKLSDGMYVNSAYLNEFILEHPEYQHDYERSVAAYEGSLLCRAT